MKSKLFWCTFCPYYDVMKTVKIWPFCEIFRFFKNQQKKSILCASLNFSKKSSKTVRDLIFFSSESWKSILSEKKAPFTNWYNADAQFKKKAPLIFGKITNFQKIEKRRFKRRLLVLAPWWHRESKKRLFFDLGLTGFGLKALFGF